MLALKAENGVVDEIAQAHDLSIDEDYAMACGDPNHLIGECSKPPKNNDQRAFIGGVWSDNGEDEVEKTKDETCLVAQAPDEICLGINLEPDECIKDSGCSKHMTVAIRNHDSFDVDNPFDSIFVCMNLLVLVWNMLEDSFPYLDYLKLDHCYILPISLPELFVSSHGGTMTMSLMHQWHDTICGGVISPRRSLLYGAYGCILGIKREAGK
ncbi:hypothetical protein Tco_1256217 [Tanacetum coccineum]